ncbi:MAG TPA: hypothetical protein VK524_13925 [Polyangiaceae bacterium]|nr:hypothetical protein [Polyangiaceae bacterium]
MTSRGYRSCLALLVALAPARASAAETHTARDVHLTWSAPDTCPHVREVTERMERLLSRSAGPRTQLYADGSVRSDPHGYRLEMRIGQGERPALRSMRATSCRELSDAAALILALLVDPQLQIEEEPRVPSPVSTPRPAPARSTSAERVSPQESGTSWGAAGGPVLAWGALPGAAPGLTAAGFAEVGRIRLELGALWLPYAKRVVQDSDPEPPKGGKLSLIAGAARACYLLGVAPELGACAGGELGVLGAKGFGTEQDRRRSVLWAALGPGLAAALPLGQAASLALGADLLFALNRPRFELDNVGLVHRPAPVGLRLKAGVLLHFR